MPYCVDHQRKRKRQTDAAKGSNLYDDDDEISTGERVTSNSYRIVENERFLLYDDACGGFQVT